MRRALGVAGAVAATLLGAGPALACGGMVSSDGTAELTASHTLLTHDGSVEEVVTSVGFVGGAEAADGFAWLMPFPEPPEVSEADPGPLRAARELTAPPLRSDHVPSVVPAVCACGAGGQDTGGAPGSVDVLGRTVVEDLELVTLGGDQAEGVAEWMRDNGFVFHDRQKPVIQDYLDRDWVIVAARALPGSESSGALTPIRFRFEVAAPVFPLAIAGADHLAPPLELSLYLVTPYRPAASTYDEIVARPNNYGDFALPHGRLQLRYSAPLPAAGRERLGDLAMPEGKAWLTWYEASLDASNLTNDLVIGASVHQTPLDYTGLLDRWRGQRTWAYVGRVAITWLLLTPIVLIVAGLVVLVKGATDRGFSDRPAPPG